MDFVKPNVTSKVIKLLIIVITSAMETMLCFVKTISLLINFKSCIALYPNRAHAKIFGHFNEFNSSFTINSFVLITVS